MWEVDFFRLIFAFLGGALLNLAGSLVQLSTGNPLATPSTLGMDGVGVLLVMLAHGLLLFWGVNEGWLDLCALSLGLGFVLILRLMPVKWWIRESGKAIDTKMLVLIGLTFNLLIGSLFVLLQFLYLGLNIQFPTRIWFGQFHSLGPYESLLFATSVLGIILLLIKNKRPLQVLMLGAGWARTLQVPLQSFYRDVFIVGLLATFLVVTQFGVFSFIGLVFPLLWRRFSFFQGRIWREIVVGSALSGFIMGLLDTLVFNITPMNIEIPVGIIASIVGAISLVIILWRDFNRTHFH